MTTTEEYAAYVAVLQSATDLPKVYAAQIESIERRAADDTEALNRRRNEGAQHWTQFRDTSSRPARRINDLASKVGAPAASSTTSEPIVVAAIPAALESLRADLERAEQSWQWLVRHRERERAVVAMPPPAYIAPTPPPPPAPEPPAPSKAKVNPVVLIGVAGVVIVILVIVIIVMAV